MTDPELYKIWLIEDDQKVIGAFSNAMLKLGGEMAISSTFHEAFSLAPRMGECGITFVDNTLFDDDDVGPAIVSRLKALRYKGVVVSNSFGRLNNPIKGSDMAFSKDKCTPQTIADFIVQNYPADYLTST